jgi:hypothetical protein
MVRSPFVNGGGARDASDEVFQHNGGRTVHVKNFFTEKVGKLYRSCGNCKEHVAKHVIMVDIHVHSGKAAADINPSIRGTLTSSFLLL